MTKSIGEIPGLGWTADISPRLARLTLDRVVDKAAAQLDPRIRRLSREARQEGPAKAAISDVLTSIAPDINQFVQIGAHDGSFDDPFSAYIDEYPWLALLVEPQADQYSKLVARYAGNERVSTRQVAVSSTAGRMVLYRAILPDHLEQGTAIAASDLEQVLYEVKRCVGRSALRALTIEEEVVPVITLDQLLTDAGIKPESITLFASDTEGHDAVIVRRLVGFLGIDPEVIHYEHLHAKAEEIQRLERILCQKGYKLIKTHKDTLAYK